MSFDWILNNFFFHPLFPPPAHRQTESEKDKDTKESENDNDANNENSEKKEQQQSPQPVANNVASPGKDSKKSAAGDETPKSPSKANYKP